MVVFASGSYVFVRDEDEMFLPAKVLETFHDGQKGKVEVNGHLLQLNGTQTKGIIRMDDQSLHSIANMVELKELNDASILHNLRIRFAKDDIYTNVGSILVSVNPFKLLPIYTPELLEKYMNNGARGLPPHVYGVADSAYKSMIGDRKSQCCIVSGESGAGKTEATKIFLQYIAEISGSKNGKSKDEGTASLQEQILKANPLMEAFGNAKTIRNNNSSRFGKWIEVKFNNQKGSVIGGSITQYLLEKSRLVHQAEGERNYHIFYQICAGAGMDKAVRDKFRLEDPDQYYYLSQSGVISVEGINDERDWEDVLNSMETIGISNDQQDDIIRTLAGILHLGNIVFESGGKDKYADGSVVSNKDMLQLAASQFGVSDSALEKALCNKAVVTSRETIFKANNEQAARDQRDVLAKEIYAKLFDWLIARINQSLSLKEKSQIPTSKENQSIIGVLDIFGFESFEYNSFEQLCINYCNEKLQFHFNEHIFKLEQKEYKAEGIDVSQIDFTDNQPTLNMFEDKKKGIFAVVDEEGNIPRGTDEGMLVKMVKAHDKHANFGKPGVKTTHERQCFTVIHYAGAVMYNVTGFLEKNKDQLSPDLVVLCKSSKIGFVSGLLPKENKKAKKQSLGNKFKEQLADLMNTLNATDPHFIRCIKPNDEKVGNVFTAQMILDQLRYAGLLEVCRIRQIGYPVRKAFKDFFRRFIPLAPGSKDVKMLCHGLQTKKFLPEGDYQIGKTQVFLRTGPFNNIEAEREKALRTQAILIQKLARRFINRCRYLGYKATLIKLRKGIVSRNYETLKDALSEAGDLPNQGQSVEVVHEAWQVLQRLEEERRVIKLLEDAIKQREVNSLRSAVSAAQDMKLKSDVVKKAQKLIDLILKEKAALEDLQKCIKARQLKALDKAIKTAKSLKLTETKEMKQALVLKERLDLEDKAVKELKAAIKNKNLQKLRTALHKAQELGISDPAVETANKLKDELLASGDAAESASVLAEENATKAEREKKITDTKQMLIDAAKENDLEKLAQAKAKVLEIGITGKEIDDLISTGEKLESQKEELDKISAAVKTMKTKAQSKTGIVPKDIDDLTKTIKAVQAKGVTESVKQMKDAVKYEKRMRQQIIVQKQLEAALKSNDLTKLTDALDAAGDIDCEIELVQKVRQIVKQKNAEKPKKTVKREERDVDEDEFELQRKENMAKASHERYNFRKYYKIRSDGDYVKGIFFNKSKFALSKLLYQKSVIPRSILDLDKELNKMAIGVHKSLLGYCGEQLMSFRATLAQDILIKGLEQPDLVDEIYIQIMKHLTNNNRPESVGRAWQVMCMAVGTFPPSADFEYFLLNFLIEHLTVSGLVGNYARYSLRRLEGMLIRGASGFVPNIDEILAYKERPPILATIELVDGTPLTEDLPVTPDLNVDKVLEICIHFLSLQDERANTFGIFVVDNDDDFNDDGLAASAYSASRAPLPGADEPGPPPMGDAPPAPEMSDMPPRTPRPLRGKDYMGDVVVQMTRQKRNITFVFKRKIFLPNSNGASDDPVYSRLMYLQAADEVIAGNIPILDEAEVIDLTVMAIAADNEVFPKSESALLGADLMEYIPLAWRSKKNDQAWAQAILAVSSKVSRMSLDSLQANYVKKVCKNKMFGMSFFFVRKDANGADLICAINSEGIHFLGLNRQIQQSYKYSDVTRWGGSSTVFWILVKEPKSGKKIKLALFSSQARDMSSLILDYALLNADGS